GSVREGGGPPRQRRRTVHARARDATGLRRKRPLAALLRRDRVRLGARARVAQESPREMNMTIILLLFALFQQHEAHVAADRPATLMTGLGKLNHPIATKSREAQQFFNQGLTLVYGFNHDEAIRSFRRAAELAAPSPMP